MSKFLYCPVCGAEVNPIANCCAYCDAGVPPKETLHDWEYYQNKSTKIHGNPFHNMSILLNEEVKPGGLFDESKYKMRLENKSKKSDDLLKKMNSWRNNGQNKNQQIHIPKCPTCQSSNIHKLSVTKRMTHGLAFGLFSKTARSQWECKDCGNKW